MSRPCVAGAHGCVKKREACPDILRPLLSSACMLRRQCIAFCARRARHETFETGKINRLRSDCNFPSETTRKDSESQVNNNGLGYSLNTAFGLPLGELSVT